MIRCFAHWCDQSWEIFMLGIKSSEAVSRTYWLVWLIMPVHLVFDTPTYSCMTFEGLLRWGPYVYNQLRMSQKSQQPFKLWAEIHQHTFNAPTLVCCAWGENLAPAELLGSSSWAIEVVGSTSEPQREHVAHDDQAMLRPPLYFPSNGAKEALRSNLFFKRFMSNFD